MFDFLSGDWLAIGIFAVVGLLGWGLTGAVVGLLVAAGLLLGARLVGIVIGVPIHLLFAWLKPDAYPAWAL